MLKTDNISYVPYINLIIFAIINACSSQKSIILIPESFIKFLQPSFVRFCIATQYLYTSAIFTLEIMTCFKFCLKDSYSGFKI
jgi:hypothetical protein